MTIHFDPYKNIHKTLEIIEAVWRLLVIKTNWPTEYLADTMFGRWNIPSTQWFSRHNCVRHSYDPIIWSIVDVTTITSLCSYCLVWPNVCRWSSFRPNDVKQLERDQHLVIAAFIFFLPENVFFRRYFFFKLQRTQMLTPVWHLVSMFK